MAKVSIANVAGVNLEIPDRSFTVITGPAGCGKTALLRAIAGLDEISQGEIFIADRQVNNLKPSEREVAMVFSDDALYPAMSARQNIAHGLKLRKFSQSETARRVDDAAEALGIRDVLDRYPRELSATQRQRVAMARAIARQARIILLDEPLANFDAAPRAQMRVELRKLHERLQTTVIHATRDPAEALALGERIVVLDGSGVAQHDLAAAIYEKPVNLFVAGFLGTPPMNFIHGILKVEREFLRFTEANEGTIDARIPLSGRMAAAEFAGKTVVLGIRPEDVVLAPRTKGQESGGSNFPALVDFVETIGAEITTHLHTGAHTIVSRRSGTAGDEPAGRRAQFQINFENAHFFDPVSTLRAGDL